MSFSLQFNSSETLQCVTINPLNWCWKETVSSVCLHKLSIHGETETVALVWVELNCPPLASGLFVNKAFIRGLLDRWDQGSFLPLGDNWPTHAEGQDSDKGDTRAPEEKPLIMHTHTMSLTLLACHTLITEDHFFLDEALAHAKSSCENVSTDLIKGTHTHKKK